MARGFTAASTQYLNAASSGITAAPFTISAWVRRRAAGTPVIAAFASTSAADNWFALGWDTTTLYGWAHSAVADGYVTGGTLVLSQWTHVAYVEAASNSRYVYTAGVQSAPEVTACTPASINNTSVGALKSKTGITYYMGGGVAHVATWAAALSIEDIRALAAGVYPPAVSHDSIVNYWPLLGSPTAGPERDYLLGTDLLPVNAPPPDEDGPLPLRRETWRPRQFVPGTSAGPGGRWTYEINPHRTLARVIVDWTAQADGTLRMEFDGRAARELRGRPVRLVTVPSKSIPPTANYDVTLEDQSGLDVLRTAGANRSATLAQSAWISGALSAEVPIRPIVLGEHTLAVANAGAAASARAVLYLALARQDWH